MHRLVAYAHNGVQRFSVDRATMVIGSADSCDIQLPFSGVGSEHARLSAQRRGLRIEDLGTRKGVLVNGQRVKTANLQPLDEVRLGSIALLVEDVVATDDEQEPIAAEPEAEPVIDAARLVHHLARISEWVLSDAATSRTLESLAIELVDDFAGGVLFLFQGEGDAQEHQVRRRVRRAVVGVR